MRRNGNPQAKSDVHRGSVSCCCDCCYYIPFKIPQYNRAFCDDHSLRSTISFTVKQRALHQIVCLSEITTLSRSVDDVCCSDSCIARIVIKMPPRAGHVCKGIWALNEPQELLLFDQSKYVQCNAMLLAATHLRCDGFQNPKNVNNLLRVHKAILWPIQVENKGLL